MILIINNSITDPFNVASFKKIVKLITLLLGKENIIVNNGEDINQILCDSYDIKWVILSGSELRINEKIFVDTIANNILPLIIKDIPILGVCFGHQLLGKLYQGKINSLSKLNEGNKIVKFSKSSLFKGISSPQLYYFNHYDYISKVPYHFKVIATTSYNRIAAIQHNKNNIFGIQFHPEFNDSLGLLIYKNFIDICYSN